MFDKLITLSNVVLQDCLNKSHGKYDNKVHIQSAMDWLCRAQDSSQDGGVSEGYHLRHGWLASYPETTGYIIETLFDYCDIISDSQSIRQRAIKMADWLVSIQNDDGSIPDSYFKKKMVFDTGQVIFGLVRAFEETANTVYKEAAIKAADWLVLQQEKDGTWIKHAANNIPHTYYSRVAWSLLKVHQVTSNDIYSEACQRNIVWSIGQQNQAGWFNQASFNLHDHNRPFTHTIAYTLRGILETGIYLNNDLYINTVKNALDNLSLKIPASGSLYGSYDKDWNSNDTYSCLTGNAQMSIIFNKLYMLSDEIKYNNAAIKINNYNKTRQNTLTNNMNIKGAIAGSYPVWGKYIHFCYPNWAAKFFIESLLTEIVANKKYDTDV